MDPLLERYVHCDETASAAELLQELVETARPTIESVVRRRLAFSASAEIQDREDVCGEVVLELLGRLRAIREGDDAIPIEDFSGYVAAAANHACDEYLRRKYPQRRRLKTKLRYFLSTQPEFAVWENPVGPGKDWFCGLKAWQLQGKAPARSPVEDWDISVRTTDRSRQGMVAMLAAVFDAAQGPILLDQLVGIVAKLWGVTDRTAPLDPEDADASRFSDPESHWVQRSSLQYLWNEIGSLPLPQRVALLLNLRSGEGSSPIMILPLMGIASIRQIAELLNIPAEEFAELWNQLPSDDLIIASRLGATRQQVINLRKSARERLRRRIASRGATAGSAGF